MCDDRWGLGTGDLLLTGDWALEDTVRVGYDILYRPGTFSYILLSVFIKSNLEHARPIAKKSCRHDKYHADMIFIMSALFLSTNANQIERLCDESVGWSGEDGDGWAVVHKNTPRKRRFDSRSRFVVSAISSPAIATFEIHGEDVVWRTASCSLFSILQNARAAGPTADRRSSHPPQKQSLAGNKRNTTINQWQWQ